MKCESEARRDGASDLQLEGMVFSLSEWANIDALTNVRVTRSILPGCAYGDRLSKLQAARRFLNVRIEDQQREGLPTAELEQDLEATRMETRAFLVYLENHAGVRL